MKAWRGFSLWSSLLTLLTREQTSLGALTTATTFGQLLSGPATQNHPTINTLRGDWYTQDNQRIIPHHVIWGLCSLGAVAPAWPPLLGFQRSWYLLWVVRPFLVFDLSYSFSCCGVQRYISGKRVLWCLGDVRTAAGILGVLLYLLWVAGKDHGTFLGFWVTRAVKQLIQNIWRLEAIWVWAIRERHEEYGWDQQE